jgi:hypothetical protein
LIHGVGYDRGIEIFLRELAESQIVLVVKRLGTVR